jgi:hypothetical protein
VLEDESDDLEVRRAAVRAIGRSRGAVNKLTRRFHPAPLRAQAVTELERIAREPLDELFERRLQADLEELRRDLGAFALVNLGRTYGRDRRVIEIARSASRDERPSVRSTALAVLAEIGEIDDLLAGAVDPDIEVRARIAHLLGFFSLGRPQDVAALERLAADSDSSIALKARSAMRRIGALSLPVPRKAGERSGDPAWIDLLERIATRILADREKAVDLPDEFLETGWLGTRGATTDELASLERRLGLSLPPSYRSFLATTNGWGPTSFAVQRLLAADEVVRFADAEPEWVRAWEDNEEGPAIRSAVQISTVFDGAVCLLVPGASANWETWLFANWLPGADAYPSFHAFMEGQLQLG